VELPNGTTLTHQIDGRNRRIAVIGVYHREMSGVESSPRADAQSEERRGCGPLGTGRGWAGSDHGGSPLAPARGELGVGGGCAGIAGAGGGAVDSGRGGGVAFGVRSRETGGCSVPNCRPRRTIHPRRPSGWCRSAGGGGSESRRDGTGGKRAQGAGR
jgi:hypothetical protein